MKPQDRWSVYRFYPSMVLGFHGCDQRLGESVLAGRTTHLQKSENIYDWLGHGVYFWDSSPQRAYEFAQERAAGGRNSKGDIKTPFVLGAVIDLGCCLNLSDSSALSQLKDAYRTLKDTLETAGDLLPTNGQGKLRRVLDCAVIETLHEIRKQLGEPTYDSVRGTFFEGQEIYPGAGFKSKDHTQICVRNIQCIKGYFRPIEAGLDTVDPSPVS